MAVRKMMDWIFMVVMIKVEYRGMYVDVVGLITLLWSGEKMKRVPTL